MQHSRSVAVSQVHEDLVLLVRELMSGERPAGGLPTFAQHAVLSYISRFPGCRAIDVSDAFAVHRSTVSRQLHQCVDAGWVQVAPGPVRQGRPLTLTEVGSGILADADRDRRLEVQARVGDWSSDDVAEFAHLLHHFRSKTTPVHGSITNPGDDHNA